MNEWIVYVLECMNLPLVYLLSVSNLFSFVLNTGLNNTHELRAADKIIFYGFQFIVK
jgi:hypothetical protein